MRKILAIALNTFREAVRNRILYIILIFALLLLIGSGALRNFTIAAEERIIQNFGMLAISFFGLLISIFLGINLIYNELEKRTIYTIVSKPIDRHQFLLGKYFGLLMTIYVNVLVMSLFFMMALHWQHLTESETMSNAIWEVNADGDWERVMSPATFYMISLAKSAGLGVATFFGAYSPAYTSGLMLATWATCLELAVVTAFVTFYSTFATPVMTAVFSIMTFIIGRLSEDIFRFAQRMAVQKGGYEALETSEKAWHNLAVWAFHIAPNLTLFNRRDQVIYPDESVGAWFMGYSILYCVLYAAMLLALAVLIFRRRNFK